MIPRRAAREIADRPGPEVVKAGRIALLLRQGLWLAATLLQTFPRLEEKRFGQWAFRNGDVIIQQLGCYMQKA